MCDKRRPPFPVNLCDWLLSDSRDRRRDAWAGVLQLSIHYLIGTDPLVVCHPLADKEQASANQRPFHHSVWNNRGHMQEGLSQSEASPPLGAESAVICYRDPYKLRCISALGSVLGVSVVADTSDWCSRWHSNCIDT